MKKKKKQKRKILLKRGKIIKRNFQSIKINLSSKKWVISFIIIDILVLGCFIMTYGISSFKDYVITTAMTTRTHKYIAHTFYDDKIINKVLSENKVYDFDNGSDATKVVIGGIEDNGVYASAYEKEILKREEGQEYKLLRFQYKGFNCYMAVIYDSKRVSLMQSIYAGVEGQTLTNMSAHYGAKVAINASGFIDPNGYGNGGIVAGIVIKDGKIISGSGNHNVRIAGFNNDGVLVLTYMTANQAIANGIKDAIQPDPFPFLIIDGQPAKISGNGGWGYSPRTVIAQRQDGIVLFLAVDGNGISNWNLNRGGVDMNELIEILERYGAYNATSLDGGASTTIVIDGQLINKPCGLDPGKMHQRRLPNAWMYK